MSSIRRNRFRNYLTLEAVVVVAVIFLFQGMSDRALASLIASFLFLVSSTIILVWELKHPGFLKRSSFWGVAVFLFSSVLPIIYLRLTAGSGLNFSEAQLGGITGAQLHEISNKVFLLMLVCFFVDSFLDRQKQLVAKVEAEEEAGAHQKSKHPRH